MKLKKVCHLTSVHIPFDTRIFHREAKTLARGNYRTVLIARHTKAEEIDGVSIVPLPAPKNRFDRITRLPFIVLTRALRERADVYHFHDPELLPVGIALKLLTRAKVIYDVHEDYSKKIADKEWLGNAAIAKTAAFFTGLLERCAARLFDRIVTVVDDIARKFPAHKTVVIRNYVSLEMIDRTDPVEEPHDGIVIVYAGRLSRKRGISEIISAMEFVEEPAELRLMGTWDTPEFEAECRGLRGWERTRYLGTKNVEEVYGFLKAAEIGLHCVYMNDYYMKGLPTKVFEYAACSLPVVMTRHVDWEELFGEFALFIDPNDPNDIAAKISLLAGDRERRRSLGKKAREFAEAKYNWEGEAVKLLDLYDTLLKDEA